jgi:hypothetical protein
MRRFALAARVYARAPGQAADSIASQETNLSASRILVLGARAEAVRLCQLSLCTEPIDRRWLSREWIGTLQMVRRPVRGRLSINFAFFEHAHTLPLDTKSDGEFPNRRQSESAIQVLENMNH